MTNIYYAHSKLIYNTEKEDEQLELISYWRKSSTTNIINPNGWIAQDISSEEDIMKQCFKFIDVSDKVVFSCIEKNNNLYVGRGVFDEVIHAINSNKDIYMCHGNKIYKFNSEFIKIFVDYYNTKSMKYYARVEIIEEGMEIEYEI